MIFRNSKKKRLFNLLILFFIVCRYTPNTSIGPERIKTIPIDYVPASFPVNFSLFTAGSKQYVAFYDSFPPIDTCLS